MREILVNPEYENLRGFLERLPDTFDSIEEVIQNNRNDIRICEVGGVKLVIKAFKGMYLPNRIAYSLLTPSKAYRSYHYSHKLLAKGINVPKPIGYVDCYELGLLMDSYYVSAYFEHTLLREKVKERPVDNDLLKALAKTTVYLHRSGVYHPDYSVGNILCNHDGNQHTFSFVDLNRVRFGEVSPEKGLQNFSTLDVPTEMLDIIIKEYAELSGLDPSEAQRKFHAYNIAISKKRGARRKMKRILVGLFKKS